MSSRLPKMPQYVYFIRRVGGVGPIKIGYSEQPKARCNNISQTLGEKVEILAFCAGSKSHESILHKRFSACRVEGEWFEATEELLAYVEEVGRSGELQIERKYEEAIHGRVIRQASSADIRRLFLKCRKALRLKQWEWGILLGFEGERASIARKVRRYESGETDIDGPMKKLVELIAAVLEPLMRANT